MCVCSCFFFSFPLFFLAVTKKYKKKVVSQSPVFFFSSLFPNHGLFLLNRFSFFLFSFWCFLQSTSKKKRGGLFSFSLLVLAFLHATSIVFFSFFSSTYRSMKKRWHREEGIAKQANRFFFSFSRVSRKTRQKKTCLLLLLLCFFFIYQFFFQDENTSKGQRPCRYT